MRLIRVLLAATTGTFAGLAFGPVFGGFPGPFLLALVAGGAAGLATGLTAALTARPRPRFPTPTLLGGAALVVLAALITTKSTLDILDGPWQLLTRALPADPTGPPLAAVAVLAGWSTVAGCLLAAYPGNPLRPLGPPLVTLIAALSLGASVPPLPAWYAPALLTLAVGVLVAGRPSPPSPAAGLAVAATALAAVVAAVTLGPVAPGRDRPPADVRALLATPVQPRSGVSPLQQYPALRDGTRPVKLAGTVSRPGSLLRMATLTSFDGLYWTVDGDYRRAGTRLPGIRSATDQVTVSQRVRVTAGELDWLLTAGRPTRVSVSGLGVDEATGDVAIPVDTAPPREYSASSVVSDARLGEILAADPVPTTAAPDKVPAPIMTFLDATVRDEPPGANQLLALYSRFTAGGVFQYDQSADASGGHGYFQIQRLLATRRGTSEQYASAYAVMARALGFDARVVMGFRPHYRGEAFTATGADVDAWTEVNFAGLGWISLDPSPRNNPVGTRPNAPTAVAPSTVDDQLKEANQPTPPPVPDLALTDEGDSAVAGARPGAAGGRLLTLAGAGLMLVLLVTASPGAKAVRRFRRRRGPSDRRAILGAWTDTLDRLRETGVPVRSSHSTVDVIRVAPVPLSALATAVDHAAYAPEEPGRDARARAWTAADQIRRQLRAGLSRPRRLGAALDPRPLLRRSSPR